MGVVSRSWVWLVGVGGIYGCGCKEVYRFPHITYPYSSCIGSFLKQHPYFRLFLKMFFVLVYKKFLTVLPGSVTTTAMISSLLVRSQTHPYF